MSNRNFPSSPVVKTLYLQCRRNGFDPWPGNYDPHAMRCSQKKTKQTYVCVCIVLFQITFYKIVS